MILLPAAAPTVRIVNSTFINVTEDVGSVTICVIKDGETISPVSVRLRTQPATATSQYTHIK